MYSVYKHTNKKNGKSYVGITSMAPKDRWSNGHGYRQQKKFYNAIVKYGWDGFTHEILATCKDKETAYELEIALIKKYDCVDNGYNVSDGGDSMDYAFQRFAVDKYEPSTGKFICTYESVSEAAKDTMSSDSHISECCRGKHKTAAGYGWAYHGEQYIPPSAYYRYCRVEKIDTDTGAVIETYDSQREAAEKNGLSMATINICCKGKQATGGGFIWRYEA